MKFFKTYFVRHCQAAVHSLGQISRAPMASLMTCLVIGITLALPTALFVALKNFSFIGNHLQQSTQMTLYLKIGSKETDAIALKKQIEKNNTHISVKIISPATGLKEIQHDVNFAGAFSQLPENPLPWSLIITPQSNDQLESLAESLRDIPQIDSIQMDETWVKRLSAMMLLAQRIAYALIIFLGAAVFLIINNVIRSATQQNQKEIELIKLIGGTSAFIRRPFLYAGMLYGLLGGIVCWQIIDILLLLLKNPTTHLAELYQSAFQLQGIGLNNTLILLGFSMTLGLLASWFAVATHLKK